MRALVISGGGSKGAFAGGVAQYLIEELHQSYDIFIGSSTGSLLIPDLALGKIDRIREVYTHVNQHSIFNVSPFVIKRSKKQGKTVRINHFNVFTQFLRRRKTFGESKNLRKTLVRTFPEEDFNRLKASGIDVVVTVSNLSKDEVEFKSIRDYNYEDFCDWIWISCNYIPFMSLVQKNHNDYADGGFGGKVPIAEAIRRGADVVDVIVLETEVKHINHLPAANAFSLLTDLHLYMTERVSKQNVMIGKLYAKTKGTELNFYYTPTELTLNSLIFDRKLMTKWWQMGFEYAKNRNQNSNEVRFDMEGGFAEDAFIV